MTQPGPNTAREEMKCTLEGVRNAHQQPITCMEVVNGMVFTGSQDHTLKVSLIFLIFQYFKNLKYNYKIFYKKQFQFTYKHLWNEIKHFFIETIVF